MLNGTYLIKNNTDTLIILNSTLVETRVRAITLNSKGEVFAGNNHGLYRLENDYSKWNNVLSKETVLSININSKDEMLIGCLSGNLYYSNDTGKSFLNIINITKIANKNVLSLVTFPDGSLLAGTEKNGIYKTDVNLAKWINVSDDLLKNQKIIYLARDDSNQVYAAVDSLGIYKSNGKDFKWFEINTGLGNKNVKSILETNTGSIIAVTDSGAYKSVDRNSWKEANNGIEDMQINSIAINSKNKIFITTNHGFVYSSSDNGDTWLKRINGLPYNISIKNIAFNSKDEIYVGTWGKGIFHSTDDGNSWQSLNFGLRNYYINSIIVTKQDELVAATPNATFYSNINGSYWEKEAGADINILMNYKNRNIIAGTLTGVYFADSTANLPGRTFGWTEKQGYKEQKLKIDVSSFIRFSKDGKTLFTLGSDIIFRRWDVETGILLDEYLIPDNYYLYNTTYNVRCFDLDEDEKTMVISSADGVARYSDVFVFNEDSLIFKIDSKYNYSCSIWNCPFFNNLVIFNPKINQILTALTIDEDHGGVADIAGYNHIWDRITGKHISTEIAPDGAFELAFSPDYNYLVISSYGRYYSNQTHGGQYICRTNLSLKNYNLNKVFTLFNNSNDYNYNIFHCLRFSPDSKYLVTRKDNEATYLFNTLDGTYLKTLNIPLPYEMQFSLNNKYLLTEINYHSKVSIKFWHLESSLEVDSLDFDDTNFGGIIAISPDSSSIVVGGYDGILRIFKPAILSDSLNSFFIADKPTGDGPLQVKFYDLSTGKPDSLLWDFGDGTTSNEQNPTHIYNLSRIIGKDKNNPLLSNTSSSFTVKLTIYKGNKSKTTIKENYIIINEPTAIREIQNNDININVLPNPFSSTTNIVYTLPQPSFVRLGIYDILGNEIAVPICEFQEAGEKQIQFDGSGFSPGMYFYRFQTEGKIFTGKLMIFK